MLTSTNPSKEAEIVGTTDCASDIQACIAVFHAKEAFPAWRATPVKARADVLRGAARIIRDNKFDYASWIVLENGKSWREADIEVCECIDFLEFYAMEAERIMAPRTSSTLPGESNSYLYQPKGVCAVIAPWNFPLAILAGMAAAALVTGNTVVMKPSEQTPVIGALLQDVFEKAGTPPGVVNYLPGKGEEAGDALVKHPSTSIIAFTGSKNVGLLINKTAADTLMGQERVKRVVCEMGGKNAIIVDDDADLDEAIQGVMRSAFNYAGQKCSACSRVIAVGSAYDALLPRLAEAVNGLKVADASDPSCVVSPVIDAEAQKRVLEYIEIGKSEAKLAAQVDVSALAGTGYFVPPTLFSEVQPTHRIAQEEIFGPVLCMMRAPDFDHAIKMATGVEFALTGAVYSRSPANIQRAMEDFRVGNLYINRGCTGAYVCRQPFGGFKMSGIGSKAGGPDYLLQFLEPRTITENTMRRGFAPELKIRPIP